jgi:predicted nucleotidyltransferase
MFARNNTETKSDPQLDILVSAEADILSMMAGIKNDLDRFESRTIKQITA